MSAIASVNLLLLGSLTEEDAGQVGSRCAVGRMLPIVLLEHLGVDRDEYLVTIRIVGDQLKLKVLVALSDNEAWLAALQEGEALLVVGPAFSLSAEWEYVFCGCHVRSLIQFSLFARDAYRQ
jgi:hypothetical protein